MQMDFKLNHDVLAEIFGYLSALDVLRCRRVCRQMNRASRERFVWVMIHTRSLLPLPNVDLVPLSAKGIEALVTRAAVLDRKWTAPRPPAPKTRHLSLQGIEIGLGRGAFVGMWGRYAVFLQRGTGYLRSPDSFCWYRIDQGDGESHNPVFKYDFYCPAAGRTSAYQSSSSIGRDFAYHMDTDRGILYITTIIPKVKPPQIQIARVNSGNFEVKAETIHLASWKPKTLIMQIVNGYLVCCSETWSAQQTIELVHIQTKGQVCASINSEFSYPPASPPSCEYFFTPLHFIRIVDEDKIEVFELPNMSSIVPGTVVTTKLQPVYSGGLSQHLTNIHVLPSTSSSLAIVGALEDSQNVKTLKVALMSLDIDQQTISMSSHSAMTHEGAVEDHRGLVLVYSQTSHCAAGIIVSELTGSISYWRPQREEPRQEFKYVQVTLGDNPRVSMNDLSIPAEIATELENFQSIDIYTGRLLFRRRSLLARGTPVTVLEYL